MRIAMTLGLSVALGCASEGGLGQVSVSPDCADEDLLCLATGLDGPIAVGATLPVAIDFAFPGSEEPELVLTSANEEVLSVEARRVVGQAPGVSALIVGTPDDQVIDFVHLFVREPDGLDVIRHDEDGRPRGPLTEIMELLVGDRVPLSVRPRAEGAPLSGSFEATWRSDSGILTLLRDGRGAGVEVVARQPGAAVITVEHIGLEATVNVVVLP